MAEQLAQQAENVTLNDTPEVIQAEPAANIIVNDDNAANAVAGEQGQGAQPPAVGADPGPQAQTDQHHQGGAGDGAAVNDAPAAARHEAPRPQEDTKRGCRPA